MQITVLHLVLIATTSAGFLLTQSDAKPQAHYSKNDAKQIGDAAGTPATLKAGVVRIGWARGDVKVTVDGMPLKPFAGISKANVEKIVHNHMIGEEPAFYFTHYWGKGAAVELATAIRAALHAQQAVKDAHRQDEAP